jgi:ATP-dependent DNA helicase PIF1
MEGVSSLNTSLALRQRNVPFGFKRKQFPIRLSFAMTINKAQGQTIPVNDV